MRDFFNFQKHFVMKGRIMIAGALLFIAVYVSSCYVSGGYNHHQSGYREHGHSRGDKHHGGGVRHYPRR